MRLKQRLENVSLESEKEMRRWKSGLERKYLQLESDVELFVEDGSYAAMAGRLEKLRVHVQADESRLQ